MRRSARRLYPLALALTALNVPFQAGAATTMAVNPSKSRIANAPVKPEIHNRVSGAGRAPRLPGFGARTQSARAGESYFNGDHTASGLLGQERMRSSGERHFGASNDPRRPPVPGIHQFIGPLIVDHRGESVGNTWRMDNSVGEQRIRNQPLVGTGYRYSLPSTPFQGMAVRSYNRDTELNWTVGQAGVLKGEKIKSFETTTEKLTGFGARHILDQNWRAGAQTWMLHADQKAPLHYSLGGALEYQSTNQRRRHTLHAVQDDQHHWGSWLDSEQRSGPWRQRYGVYRFEPRLRWANKPMAEDREGLYWRADYERGRTAWFGGLELERTNVLAAPKVAGLVKTFGLVGIKRQVDRATGIGASIRAGVERQGLGAPAPDARIHATKVFVDREFALGASHFGARLFERISVTKPEESPGLFWDHAWLDSGSIKFKTQTGLTRLTRNDRFLVIPATGFKLKYGLTQDFELQAGVKYLWQQTGRPEEDAAGHATLGLSWLFDRRWRVSLDGRWDGEVLKEDYAHRDFLNRVFLTLAYQPARSN